MPVAIPTWRNVELMPDAMPGPRGRDDADRGVGDRRVDRADPEARDDEAGQQRRPVVARVEAAHEQQAGRRRAAARRRAGRAPAAARELARDRRGDERQQPSPAGSAGPSRAARSRGSSAGRARGRGTSRTSTPTARTPRSTRRRTSACETATGRTSGARTRRSTTTNATSSSADADSIPTMSALPQPCSLLSMSPKTSRNSAALNVVRPSQSIAPGSSSRDSGSLRSVIASVAMPIGRLR